jgi:hypothetical protein
MVRFETVVVSGGVNEKAPQSGRQSVQWVVILHANSSVLSVFASFLV